MLAASARQSRAAVSTTLCNIACSSNLERAVAPVLQRFDFFFNSCIVPALIGVGHKAAHEIDYKPHVLGMRWFCRRASLAQTIVVIGF
jgi:hypothetical protein